MHTQGPFYQLQGISAHVQPTNWFPAVKGPRLTVGSPYREVLPGVSGFPSHQQYHNCSAMQGTRDRVSSKMLSECALAQPA